MLGRDRTATEKREKSVADTFEISDAPKKRRTPRYLALLFILFPLIFVGVGGYMLLDAIRFSGVAVGAVGTVVDVDVHSDSDGTTYTPIFRYTDQDGRDHQAPTHISSSGYDYSIGSQEWILYDPGAPNDEVRIDGVFSLWGLPVIFTSVGLMVFFGFAFGFRKLRRNHA